MFLFVTLFWPGGVRIALELKRCSKRRLRRYEAQPQQFQSRVCGCAVFRFYECVVFQYVGERFNLQG